MSTQATPPNINEPYANNLATIFASIIAFLTVRYILINFHNTCKRTPQLRFVWRLTDPFASRYKKLENLCVNKFSYSPLGGACPPLGAFFLVCALISATLPLLLLNVDLAVNSNRAGFLCLAIVPFLLSSAGKNSAISFLTGISSVKMNFFHRVLGLTLIIGATVHMAPMLYSWNKFPTFMQSQLQVTKVQYGIAGYAILCAVILGSALPVRKYCYELFLGTHFLGIAFLGVIAVHTPYAMRYFVTGLFCYSLNLVAVWFVKTFMAQARFEVLPEGCTKISIRLASPMKTHYIGQHINLCIPAISAFQWHPFTITSVRQQYAEHQHSIEVCVVARGNFTRTLYNKVDSTQELRVFVSGPFGSTHLKSMDILSSHTSVIIASGGCGVTFGMRLIRELTDTLIAYEDNTDNDDESGKDLLNHWKTKDIYFYWSVRRPLELEWFREELEHINHLYDNHTRFPKFHLTLHVTGENSAAAFESDCRRPALTDNSTACSSGEINEYIAAEDMAKSSADIKQTKAARLCCGERIDPRAILSHSTDVGAFVCGPVAFNAAFKNEVASLSTRKSPNVRLHCEDFGY